MHENAIEEILQFWFEDIDHSQWFRKDSGFDRELQQRFGGLLKLAKTDQLDDWCDSPRGRLALIIVLDQFSRNIYRDTAESFEADAKALQLSVDGIQDGIDEEGRAFGHFESTGVRPASLDRLQSAGVRLPANLFAQRVLGH